MQSCFSLSPSLTILHPHAPHCKHLPAAGRSWHTRAAAARWACLSAPLRRSHTRCLHGTRAGGSARSGRLQSAELLQATCLAVSPPRNHPASRPASCQQKGQPFLAAPHAPGLPRAPAGSPVTVPPLSRSEPQSPKMLASMGDTCRGGGAARQDHATSMSTHVYFWVPSSVVQFSSTTKGRQAPSRFCRPSPAVSAAPQTPPRSCARSLRPLHGDMAHSWQGD